MADIKGQTSPFESPGESASKDAKTNKVTASRIINMPGASTIAEALDYGDGGVHPDLDIPESSRTATGQEGMGYELKIEYEGDAGDAGEELAAPEISLNRSYGEEPIESHPKLAELMKKYRGTLNPDTQKVEWEEYLEESKSTGLATVKGFKSTFGQSSKSSDKGSGKVKNPLFGVKTYPVLKAVCTVSYESLRPPRLDMINKITNSVPGGFETPDDHNWLIGPPKASRKQKTRKDGTKFFYYSISYDFILSKQGGWNVDLHDLADGGIDSEIGESGLDWLAANNSYDGEPGFRGR